MHDTARAGYPFTVIDGRGRETFDTVTADKNAGRVAIESWISNEAAHRLFQLSNLDLDALTKAAASRDFRPIPLRSKLSMTLERTERTLVSHNVVGKISGSDPSAAARYLIYTAHWDHLGRDDSRTGDPIFHGALDNASGMAGMLEIAEAWKALETPPKETVVFIATTCEERGLLGAKYYVNNPLYPLERTLAVLNFDFLNPWGRTADLQRIGERRSSLDDVLERVLKQRGRVMSPEVSPEEGLSYRADDFVFAKAGVPAMWCFRGTDFIDKPKGYGKKKYVDYIAHDYHQPSDVVRPDWDLSGAIEDLRVYFRMGHIIGDDKGWPEWFPNAEFAAKRRETASSRAPGSN